MRQPGFEDTLALEPEPRSDVHLVVEGDTRVAIVPKLHKALEGLCILVIEQGLENPGQPNDVQKDERLVANEGSVELPARTTLSAQTSRLVVSQNKST